MDPKTAFKRAALYHTCRQSKILSNVNFEQSDTESLVELVNQHNAHTIRELPILVAKVTTKGALSFLVSRFPQLRNYVEPENIRVAVESDELAYLVNAPSKPHTSIVPIVLKNLALNAVGSSIARLKEDILSSVNATSPTIATTSDATSSEAGLRERIALSHAETPNALIASTAQTSRIGDFGTIASSPGLAKDAPTQHAERDIDAKRCFAIVDDAPDIRGKNDDNDDDNANESSEIEDLALANDDDDDRENVEEEEGNDEIDVDVEEEEDDDEPATSASDKNDRCGGGDGDHDYDDNDDEVFANAIDVSTLEKTRSTTTMTTTTMTAAKTTTTTSEVIEVSRTRETSSTPRSENVASLSAPPLLAEETTPTTTTTKPTIPEIVVSSPPTTSRVAKRKSSFDAYGDDDETKRTRLEIEGENLEEDFMRLIGTRFETATVARPEGKRKREKRETSSSPPFSSASSSFLDGVTFDDDDYDMFSTREAPRLNGEALSRSRTYPTVTM